jgi:hypothetical protein
MSTSQPTVQAEISPFDAENATNSAADFLKRLGYKGSWSPMKVSLDGELFVVEMMLKQLSAKVQINSKTKEIREYELQKGEESGGAFKNKGIFIFLIAAVSIAVASAKLLGLF